MAAPATMLHIEGDRLLVPSSAFEHAGFRAWVTSRDFPHDVRATFLAGEVFIEMSPEAIESHNKVKLEVTVVLGRLVRHENLGEAYADRTLLTNEDAELSTEPDFTFASWETLRSDRLRLLAKANRGDEYVELEGTPDLVVEIVSDSSVHKDLKRLRAYFRAGIPEYWVIDARGEAVLFEILTAGATDYEARVSSGAPQRSAVFGRAFALTRHKNPVGRWTYVLDAPE